MYYLIYKITNQINGKSYIGKHQTEDLYDDYMGSGKLLKRAIEKYGIENFTKYIIEIYDTEQKMNLVEKILVVTDNEISYNLCSGGHGGFGFINNKNLNNKNHGDSFKKKMSLFLLNKWKNDEKFKLNNIQRTKELHNSGKMKKGYFGQRLDDGSNRTPEAIEKRKNTFKLNNHQQGSKNSQYGKPRSEETKRKIRESVLKTLELKKNKRFSPNGEGLD